MRIVVRKQNIHLVLSMRQMARVLASERLQTEAYRGLIDAGRKTKTQVQRAVHQQMAMIPYRFVSGNTRGTPRRGSLSFEIYALVGGQPITLYKGLRALSVRGDAFKRFTAGMDIGDRGLVRSAVWNKPRVFKRSFATSKGYFALLPGEGSARLPKVFWTFGHKPDQPRDGDGRFGRSNKRYGRVRPLYGGSLSKEIPKDRSLATFQSVAPPLMEHHVTKRLGKFMRF